MTVSLKRGLGHPPRKCVQNGEVTTSSVSLVGRVSFAPLYGKQATLRFIQDQLMENRRSPPVDTRLALAGMPSGCVRSA